MTTKADTSQLSTWTSEFGRDYTDRNTYTFEEIDRAYEEKFGIPKSRIFEDLIGPNRLASGKVLEVGCNIGLQLGLLEKVNPKLEIHGLDPQDYALASARSRLPGMFFHQGTALELPFADGSFDIVMTNGVLIHIHPDHLPTALAEICRVSARYIFAHEYFDPNTVEIPYRGHAGLMWKCDFAKKYLQTCPRLREVEIRYYPYSQAFGGNALVDQVALLEKQG